MKKLMITASGLAVAALIALGAASGSSTGGPPATGTSSVQSSPAVVQASRMTQQMSGTQPLNGHEYHNHGGDPQLQSSANPQFVRNLETYQSQVDQMLARSR